MTDRRRTWTIALLGLAMATTGCLARSTPAIHYYTVSLPTPPERTIDATVSAGALTAEPGYTESRMAWRPSPYRVDYTTFHRWVAPPARMLTSVLDDHLGRASTGNPARRVVVTGNVRRIEAVRTSDEHAAVLTLTLTAELDGTRVLTRTWDEREPLDSGDSPEDVAAALSVALERIVTDLTSAVAAAAAGR